MHVLNAGSDSVSVKMGLSAPETIKIVRKHTKSGRVLADWSYVWRTCKVDIAFHTAVVINLFIFDFV